MSKQASKGRKKDERRKKKQTLDYGEHQMVTRGEVDGEMGEIGDGD